MSAVAIMSALATALATVSPSLATAWENTPYTPVVGTAYQRVFLLMGEPVPLEQSGRVNREQGVMQVSLCYPLSTGSGAALTRAELIRATFYRGRTFTSGSTTLTIDRMPEISPALIENDRYVIPVRIRFYSHVIRS